MPRHARAGRRSRRRRRSSQAAEPAPAVTVGVTAVTGLLTHMDCGPQAPRVERGGLMQSVNVNDVELEYEVIGAGEPVLLISPVIADGFLPLVAEPALADRYRLIRYHKRGWVGSTHTPAPVSVADHAADAAALLDRLGLRRAHIAGHSSGAAVAMQLALDNPTIVQSLVLLELSLLSVRSAAGRLGKAGAAFEAYGAGDH